MVLMAPRSNQGMDINTDPGCSRTTDPDGSSLGPDVTVVPSSSEGHSDHYGPGSSMVLRHQHGEILANVNIEKPSSGLLSRIVQFPVLYAGLMDLELVFLYSNEDVKSQQHLSALTCTIFDIKFLSLKIGSDKYK
ncbi:hypothetical protein STEG23_007460 [Scotinomys teguina]